MFPLLQSSETFKMEDLRLSRSQDQPNRHCLRMHALDGTPPISKQEGEVSWKLLEAKHAQDMISNQVLTPQAHHSRHLAGPEMHSEG